MSVGVLSRQNRVRRALAWLVVFALALGGFSLQPFVASAGAADSFIAADICSSSHAGDTRDQGGPSHDCRQHCCLLSVQALPPAPFVPAPDGVLVSAGLPYSVSPAWLVAPRPTPPARAPPTILV
ncbi:MAG: hypothetical protein HY055_16960 [Magnetospirillum sp.]|nr:hypothetical protein [Magnetospirillum sp.]